MKTIKKTLLKTLFISALAGLSVLGGCKKNQHNSMPQSGHRTRQSVKKAWERHWEIKNEMERTIDFSSKQRD